jgi:alkanesulfonate monooxygenase SsuD/methylene tetrahydromethanopterin reductase-like flavin-dependent oxidoreductase (luciferase family)
MKIGLTLPMFGPQATKENIIRLSKMAEQERFDSLWVAERLLWPIKDLLWKYIRSNLETFYSILASFPLIW